MSSSDELGNHWPAGDSRDHVLVDSSNWIHLLNDDREVLCGEPRNSEPKSRQMRKARGRACPLCNWYGRQDSEPDDFPPGTCPACGFAPSPASARSDLMTHFLASHSEEVKNVSE